MERVNLYAFYELGSVLHPLTRLSKSMTWAELSNYVYPARDALTSFMDGEPVRLRNIRPVEALFNAMVAAEPNIRTVENETGQKIPDVSGWFVEKISETEVGRIGFLASRLEVVISNDFPLFHSYLISERTILSVDNLVNYPELAFREDMVERMKMLEGLPLEDFKESARCLAFGIATACGFHVVRSAEAVLRNWLCIVCSNAEFRTTWNNCVEEIGTAYEERDEAERRRVDVILGVLDQIRRTHRNPLMHPEETLNNDEAQVLFDVAKSAIFSMMKQIITLQPEV